MRTLLYKNICFVMCLVLLLSGCASTMGSNSSGEKSPILGALVGGVVGALAGAATGDSRNILRGAAIGAAVGAVGTLVFNSISKQTKSTNEVESEYRNKNAGELPSSPKLVHYQSRVEPSSTIALGSEVKVLSDIEVISGKDQPVQEIKEAITLYDVNGKEFKSGAKVVNEKGAGSGRYENSFTFKLSKELSQGVYGVKTEVYVNGEKMSEAKKNLQLVKCKDSKFFVALL